jgi:hypothetical protein
MSKKIRLKALLTTLALLMITAPAAIAEGKVIYVDATGNGDGSSWDTAYKYLQDALSEAVSGDEIWVAQGVYRPDESLAYPSGSSDRTATFQLTAGVGTYGGFPTGGGLPGERDPNAFITILSGDLNGDDAGLVNNSENSYHVVSVFSTDSSTILDGFTITAGNANSNSSGSYGGGVYNYQADPILNNCVISGNTADKRAGGLYNRQGDPTLTNCIFINNSSGNNGGAIYNHNSSPVLTNCTFIGNSAVSSGGGINNGSDSSPEVVNCTFTANSAGSSGGAIANHLSHPSVINCILWGNTAPAGPQISLLSSSWVSISYSDLQGSLEAIYDDGTGSILWDLGNIAENPKFKSDNYHIEMASPCVDAGDPARDYSGQTDIDGEPRLMGPYVDMGSDEVESPQYYYVDDDAASDPGPGSPDISDPLEDGSMEHPFDSIQEAIDGIGIGGTIFVLDGTYTGNGNHDIDFDGKEITVCSQNGPTDCTIDCENLGRGFDFHSEETGKAIVSGFTITNGWADYGGAIRCVNSSPKIVGCVITANAATNRGGGLYLNLAEPTIADCVISNNSPDGIWIENGVAHVLGTIQFVSNSLAGQGGLQMASETTLEMHNVSVFCDLFGPGTIHSGIESKLIIAGGAVIDLSNPGTPEDNGAIICDGQLQVKDEVQIHNANITITVASFEDNTSISNSVITVNSIAPYGQLFIEPNVVVNNNEIHADGDRYMNLDPSISAGGLQDTQIFVTITGGVGQTQGELLELRGQDGLVSHSCPPEQYLCQVPPGSIPDCDVTTWTLERLELIEGAKLNLTNRSIYQPPYDFGSADEVLYVRELILRQNSVLNTGFNRVYYETLIVEAGAIITDEPLLGFSLTNIAFNDATEFIIRVLHNNFEDPANPSNNRIHVERITGSPPDPEGMMKMCNLLDDSTGQVVNARAKGLFAKGNEDEVLIMFEYLFGASAPGAEMVELIVYLSDVPELLAYNDPNRIDHYLEVARLYPPPAGQDGSPGSQDFGVFETTVPAGDLNFIRGVRMELELVGPEGTCMLINNWDPFVACIYCGDVTGDFAISPIDYLTVVGECGQLSTSTSQQGQALYCLDGQFSEDGYVSTSDVSVCDWEEWQYSEGSVGNLCFDVCIGCGAGGGAKSAGSGVFASQATSVASSQKAGLADLEGPLVISGKKFDASQQSFMSDRIYEFDEDLNLVGVPLAMNNDRMNGKLVRDHEGQFYQTNLEEGLVRLSDNNIVLPRGQSFDVGASEEPRYGQAATVYVGFQNHGEDTWGRPILDAAFDSQGYIYVTPIVVVPQIADAYVASAKLQLDPGQTPPFIVIQIYDDPPLPTNNQDRTNLREIEVDNEGNIYVINTGYANSSDILWAYYNNGQVGKCDLQNLGIYGPIGLCASNYDSSRLYVAASLSDTDAATAAVHVLSTVDLTLTQTIDANGIGHITDITEEPHTGNIWVVGFTMPQYLTMFPGNLSQMSQFYDPYIASIPYGSSGQALATHLSDANDVANDLAMPLSIAWAGTTVAGQDCHGANLDGLGDVGLADFAILALQWQQPPSSPSADIAPEPDGDGIVNISDLAVVAAYWLESICN